MKVRILSDTYYVTNNDKNEIISVETIKGDLGVTTKIGSSGAFITVGRTGQIIYLFRNEYEPIS